jgi:hypothetical protein
MRSASASNSLGVTATSCTQATTPNVPTSPKRQPLLGQIYGLTVSGLAGTTAPPVKRTPPGTLSLPADPLFASTLSDCTGTPRPAKLPPAR